MQYDPERVADMALFAGHALQRCGAETFRVEDSVGRILRAYGETDIDVFAVANWLCFSFSSADGILCQRQKRLRERSDNLRQLEMLNQAIRDMVTGRPDPAQAMEKLHSIADLQIRPFWLRVLITGFIAFAFTLLIDGSLAAGAFAIYVDIVARLFLEPLYREHTNPIFINMVGGFLVTVLAWPCNWLGMGSEMNMIVAGSFMFLFPGVSLVNSIRDMVASDYLAGMTKLLETLVVATSIAVGAAVGLSLLSALL